MPQALQSTEPVCQVHFQNDVLSLRSGAKEEFGISWQRAFIGGPQHACEVKLAPSRTCCLHEVRRLGAVGVCERCRVKEPPYSAYMNASEKGCQLTCRCKSSSGLDWDWASLPAAGHALKLSHRRGHLHCVMQADRMWRMHPGGRLVQSTS